MSEALDERLKSVMIIGVFHDLFVEGLELFFVGELSVNNQESSFQEVRLLGKLLNWVSSVLQDSLLTIDE